jgi:hypothetical protein
VRGKKLQPETIEHAITLRKEQKLGYKAIAQILGVPTSTIRVHLSLYKLSPEDLKLRAKLTSAMPRSKKASLDVNGFPRPHWMESVDFSKLSKSQRGAIAEAAVLFRLAVNGFSVYGSPFDGDRIDWIVKAPGGKLSTLQVGHVSRFRYGRPLIRLTRTSHGKSRRFCQNDFDFIIGYDFHNDAAYVFSATEVEKNLTAIAVTVAVLEAWSKLL